uniref:RING-type domain-containing protein n=1 Tax=Gongylonema pulchrum TaxID=637853 RepID=A0A183DY55_9BILA
LGLVVGPESRVVAQIDKHLFQVRFAEKSGALGLVVGPESRVVAQIDKKQRGRIPVVVLDDLETKRLKKQLNEASRSGSVIRISFEYVDLEPHYTLRLQVAKFGWCYGGLNYLSTNGAEYRSGDIAGVAADVHRWPGIFLPEKKFQIFRPTVLNIGLVILLVLLLMFIVGLVYIKIRWRPNSHRDIWLRTLARSAVNKMEIRKFEKSGGSVEARHKACKKRSLLCLPTKRQYLRAFGSLTSVARSYGGQQNCLKILLICLLLLHIHNLSAFFRSAVNKMEIRKFEKSGGNVEARHKACKKRSLLCLPTKRQYLRAFGSLTSVARSYGGQERCSICLEEYKEGQELRVLFCGHEFHPKCVDPWLLSNR